MKRLIALAGVCLLAGALHGQVTRTTIAQTITTSSGTFNGTVEIDGPNLTTSDSVHHVGTRQRITVTNGVFTVDLWPNVGSNAGGQRNAYRVTYYGTGKASVPEWWIVPVSATPITISQMAPQTTPPPFEPLTINWASMSRLGATDGQVIRWSDAVSAWVPGTVSGTGDMIGPASSVDSELALFSGTGGKTLKRATATGVAKLTAGVLGVVTGTASDCVKVDGSSGSCGSGGGGTWGSITGTLSDQTDLNSALGGKEPTITAGTTSQYWRGDKTWQNISGLTFSASQTTSGTFDAARIPDLSGTYSVTAHNHSGVYEPADADLTNLGALAKTDDGVIVMNGTVPELKILPSCSDGTTSKLLYNTTTNTFTCGSDQTGAGGSGITSLGGQTGSTQTFANDTNVTMSSSSETHTLGWTGTLAVGRGGTGAGTLTGLLQGNGTSAVTAISNSSTVGQVLRVTGTSTYAWGALDLADTDAVTGILPTARGGTGNGFFTVSGPASTAKTYTFPNANATVLTTNAAVTVAQGGTGIASGTSGGIPYFSGTTTIASSAALTANAPVIGGGAGAAPTVGSRSGNTTEFATVSGTKTASKQLAFDASGNVVASAYDVGATASDAVTATSTFGTDNRLLRSDGVNRLAQTTGITVDDSNNVTGVNNLTVNGTLTVGDGTTAGALTLSETTANGSNKRVLSVPDALTADWELRFPNSVASATESLFTFPAPTAGLSTMSVKEVTNANTASTVVARDGSGNFSAGTITAALNGNATTATTLATARNIGGVSFNGSADIVPQTVQVVDSTDATSSIAMFDSATGNLQPKTDAGLTYNASTGMLTATGFTGPLTGNASTASALQTARTLYGTSFDGSANIGSRTGNTSELASWTGAKTTGKQVGIDASGNLYASANDLGGSGSGMADPMTTRGDMIVRDSGNTTARLPVGSSGTFLKSNGTDPAWSALAAGDIGSGTFADARISQSSVTQHQAALSIPWSQLGDPTADKTFNTALYKTYYIPSGTMVANTQYWQLGPSRASWNATYMADGFDYAPYVVGILNQPNQIVGLRVLNQQNTADQYVLGLSSRVYANPSSGTTPLVSGAEGDAWCGATGTGSITFCNGLVAHIHNAGTQAITNGVGMLIYEPTNPGGGGITANYGLYIQNQRNAFTTFGFAIKTGTGIVDFGSADTLILPSVASPTLATNAEIIYDTTAHAIKARVNGTTRNVLHSGSSAGDFPTLNQNTTGTAASQAADTQTLTNKTLNAESTGNSITLPIKVWMSAVGCAGTTGTLLWDTLATNAPTATCSAGTTETAMMRAVADFPDSDGAYSLQQTVPLPDDWTGNIDVKIKYRSAATTGNTVWQVQTACRADAEVDDVAWNTASTVTDAAKGTTNQLNDASITSVTATGCAAGELMHLRVLRDRTHASDTITGVISLVGVELTYRRAM